ncbi:MAG: carbohydrate ABC transporter permease [Clostridia bacterium]|nr:carbohydrate ABC transporter permease [Clostridia bacterium]
MAAIRKSRSDRLFDTVNVVIMILVLFIMAYPIYFVIIASVSDPYQVTSGNVYLAPKGFTLEAYQNVFKESRILQGYANSILYTFAGTCWNLVLTIPLAYVLSRRKLRGRWLLTLYFLIPMYFKGGLVPTYLQVKNLGLLNQPYTLIILGGLNIYNMIVARVYFQTSIPDDLYEAAHIDGASQFRTFFSIMLPLAKPILAVITLYYAVWRWNDYFNALIYTSKQAYQPLQMVLRGILLMNENMTELMASAESAEAQADMARLAYIAQTMKYALIFIASAPMLIIYPFVQKHFVKGIMIGSLKG